MNGTEGGDAQAGRDASQPDAPSGDLHDVPGVQRYAAELGRICTAIAGDEQLAQKVIDAVHGGSGASVESLFRDAGVDSRVSIETREGRAPGEFGKEGVFAADSEHTHVHVGIDFGPIHVGVDVDK